MVQKYRKLNNPVVITLYLVVQYPTMRLRQVSAQKVYQAR